MRLCREMEFIHLPMSRLSTACADDNAERSMRCGANDFDTHLRFGPLRWAFLIVPALRVVHDSLKNPVPVAGKLVHNGQEIGAP
jgi:hypothetical protein